MPGAPSIAVGGEDAANLPGMPKCSLGELAATQAEQESPPPQPSPSKPQLKNSHTVEMLAQSSKVGLEGAPTPSIFAPAEIDLATPSPPKNAPKEQTQTKGSDASLDLVTPERRTPTPKASRKPKTPKTRTTEASLDLVTPDSSASTLPMPGKKPSPAKPVARQLFAPRPSQKSQASQAPKLEGYWKLLVLIVYELGEQNFRTSQTMPRPSKGVALLQAKLQG